MYSYEKFYDHFAITKNGEILYHVDNEKQAKEEVDLLNKNDSIIINEKNTTKSSDKNYTVYHLHDDNSLLDSCTSYKQYIDKAVELGQSSICFTNHGNVHNWVEKKMYCDENGIKYMFGIECYLTEHLEPKIRDNYHTVLISKNERGRKELQRLIFNAGDEQHKYYKPRISFDEFLNISDNIIKISACLASPLNRIRDLDRVDKLFQHYDYYEIQYHGGDQIEYNQYLYEMSKKYNKPLIVGTDTHNLDKYKAECRIILQMGKDAEFGKGDSDGSDEDEFDLTYKSYNELVEYFSKQNSLPMDIVLDAIENTNVMADSVESFELDTSIKYPILYGEDDEKVMWQTLRDKYKYKLDNGIIQKNQRYIDDIKEEMRVFKKTDMIGFMLFMSELMTWCRDNGIPSSPCRGSVGGSTVAYISDITDVDPIVRNTVFSRFANEDRKELGDVDCDVYEDQRPLVYEYIINRFGKENTAFILSNGTAVDKGTIDIIGKALRKRWARKNKKDDKDLKILENSFDNPYSLSKIKQIKADYESNPEQTKENNKDIFYYFEGILGTKTNQSQHPAGIIASPINLIDNYGCFIGADGQYILPINMEEIHEINLAKYDILGLKNVGIVRKCCEYASIKYPLSHEIDWGDLDVYKDMIKSPIGIFQFEGDYAFKLLKTFIELNINDPNRKPTIDCMSLVNASLRPSGESYRDKLLAGIPNINPSKIIDDLLKDNMGYLVYQCDVIKFLQQICGLSGSEADNVRRAIGRKQMDRLQKAMPSILEGYCNVSDQPREVAEEEAKQFLQIIEDASSYMFGFNHSTGYSMVGYLCAYMRYYYPVEFCTAYLNCANNEDDILNGTNLLMHKNINLENPKFGKSLSAFVCDAKNKTIYKGLGSIKDIGKDVGNKLSTLYNNNYTSFYNLLADIKPLSINSNQLDILIKLDYFSEFGHIHQLLSQVKIYAELSALYEKFKTCKQLNKSDLILPLDEVMECCGKATEKQLREIDNDKLVKVFRKHYPSILKQISDKYPYQPTTISDKIKYEVEKLGYTSLIDESADWNNYALLSSETNQWGNTFYNLYHIQTGITKSVKLDKKRCYIAKVEVGDVLLCVFDVKKKWKMVDGKMSQIDEVEELLISYAIKD